MDHSISFTSISNTDDQRTSRLVTGIYSEKSRSRRHTKADLIFLAPSLDNFLSTPTTTPHQHHERQHEQARCALYNLCSRRCRYQEDSRVLGCLPQLKQMLKSHEIDCYSLALIKDCVVCHTRKCPGSTGTRQILI